MTYSNAIIFEQILQPFSRNDFNKAVRETGAEVKKQWSIIMGPVCGDVVLPTRKGEFSQ